MHSTSGSMDSRRRFLRYLALSPALASPLLMDGPLCNTFAWDRDNCPQASGSGVKSIESVEQVLDVMEFEELAQRRFLPRILRTWPQVSTTMQRSA